MRFRSSLLCLKPFAESMQECLFDLEKASEALDLFLAHEDDEPHRNN